MTALDVFESQLNMNFEEGVVKKRNDGTYVVRDHKNVFGSRRDTIIQREGGTSESKSSSIFTESD